MVTLIDDMKFVYTTGPETLQSLVEEFHWTFRCPVDQRRPEILSTRRRLISEEYRELRDELVEAHKAMVMGDKIPNLDKLAKESADLIYVVLGLGVELGIDLEEAIRRVHASNMSKLGVDNKPILREDGKVLKGPNYTEPNMKGTYREETDV